MDPWIIRLDRHYYFCNNQMTTDTDVHKMVRAYMRKLGKKSAEKQKRTPEQMAEMARLRWDKVKEKNEKLLSPLE